MDWSPELPTAFNCWSMPSMFPTKTLAFLLLCSLFLAAAPTTLFAENEGLAELDKATQLKVAAESLDDLGQVIDNLETALEKGLDEENTKFAQQLLVSSLVQRGTLFTSAIFNAPANDPQSGMRAMQLRQFALNDLQRAVQLDDKLADAHLLIGKLQLQIDANAARRAFTKVVDAAETTPEQKAEALALRSAVQKEAEQQIDDLNRAVELQSEKPDFLRLRAQHLAGKEKHDDALADIDRALEMDPEHAASHELRGMILLQLERYDDALASFDRASELAPDAALPYQHRGELYIKKGDTQSALEQLTKALEKQPQNITALLVRAGLYYELKEPDKALADIDEAIRIQPAFVQPHLMRAEILAASERIDEAIAGLEKLLQAAPGNLRILSQLGTFYMIDSQPRKAIDVFSRVLEQESDNGRALRFRADAYLNLGQHAEAIADFDRALQELEPDEGLLNNFAWVLATSPEDNLRDGKRAIELATKAAEMSDYQTPHVLSTLGAAYAETGDFDTAKKWSAKSIELSQKELDSAETDADRQRIETEKAQLEKELATYEEGKPVRERQNAEEKPAADSAATEQTEAPDDVDTPAEDQPETPSTSDNPADNADL
jgi:tetratricopeptide (TPR) repeat protein